MNTSRKFNWLWIAIYFNLSKLLYNRNKRLWVYGCCKGRRFDDNSNLFEYINKSHGEDIRSVWLTDKENVAQDIRNAGGEAYTFSSPEGREMACHAGVAIFTHALDDFGPIPRVGGAKLVFLGHGVGFKQTYNAKLSGVVKTFKKIMDAIFSFIQRDITITTSELNKRERLKISGMNDPSHFYITGQPRNDILKIVDRNTVLNKLGIDTNKRVILYMPTYRMPSMGKDAMNHIIKNLYECSELDMILDERNCIFIAKLHPNTPPIELPERKNFRILGYNEIEANHELLASGDILITDYSSCCVDFALLERPVIFYRPDEEIFFNHSERVCDEYFDISKNNSCSSPEKLAELIDISSLEATKAINSIYEDPSIKGTCYSDNVYKIICKELGI